MANDAPTPTPAGAASLRVLTFNVWHGLRTQGVFEFPGEDRERRERRLAGQVAEIETLDPDLMLFQEVNPAPGLARRYARDLGRDEIHKVVSCGIQLGPLRIPRNMREGLAILARPELGMKALGPVKLSGPGGCGDRTGFQTAESRFALFAEITAGDHRVLVINTHLHNFPFGRPEFRARLDELRTAGTLSETQHHEIAAKYDGHLERQMSEVRVLLEAMEKRLAGGGYRGVVLGGDFNSVPQSPVVAEIRGRGLGSAADAAAGPILTVDPALNAENRAIGSKEGTPYPTFSLPELEALFDEEERQGRQIDHVFFSEALRAAAVRRVLDRPRDGIYPSDHFGLLTELELGA